jgi:hypothetical protein
MLLHHVATVALIVVSYGEWQVVWQQLLRAVTRRQGYGVRQPRGCCSGHLPAGSSPPGAASPNPTRRAPRAACPQAPT